MNKNLKISFFIISVLFFGCRGPVKEDDNNNVSASSVQAGNKKYLAIDTKQSVVTWKGSNLAGSNSHTGFIYIPKGELKVENEQLIGGTVEVDMNTIEDEKHQSNNGLVDHLKEPDFFDVKKFPLSIFIITKAEPINGVNKKITGNLTIKGITHSISFPAKVEIKNGITKLNARLVIDRTKWNIRYKSGKFYDLLADQTISDSIEFDINLVTK